MVVFAKHVQFARRGVAPFLRQEDDAAVERAKKLRRKPRGDFVEHRLQLVYGNHARRPAKRLLLLYTMGGGRGREKCINVSVK